MKSFLEQKCLIENFQGWDVAVVQTPKLVKSAEETFDCCGSGLKEYENGTLGRYTNPSEEDKKWSDEQGVVFKEGGKCANHSSVECITCYKKIEDKVGKGFNTAGGLGLFFSFPEVRYFIIN